MSRSGSDLKDSETQSKFIQERITAVEKNFGQLCDTFSSYTRKTARLRDKGDQITKDVLTYVGEEKLNPSAKKHFTEFAQNLSAIQDYRNAQVTRLEAKVQQPLSNYGLKCKHTKADLKAAFTAREREHKIRKKLDAARLKGDTRQVATLETDLQKATVDASRTTKNLEQQMDKFELEKLQDAKKIMTDFIMIEMAFHAKALEVYSQCFENVGAVNVDQDIKEFRAKMRPSNTEARINMARSGSVSSEASTVYEDTPRADLRGSPAHRTQPQPTTNGTRSGNMMKKEAEEEDDEDDDEDDDDEEEEDDDESYEDETELETDRSAQVKTVQAVKPAAKR